MQAILDVDSIYDQSLQKLETEFAERNMSYSSAYYNAVNELEEKRNEQKAKLTTQVEEKQEVIDGKISAKEYLLTTISDTVSYKYEALIMEYVQEQQDKQRDYADSVLKYNNQIDEKIIKNDNAINQNYSKLKLDYMSIVNKGLTTEQLNSLGYYGDVIKAIDEYYYSISAQDAYNDFCLDSKMPYYLGEYYDEILYKYKLRADM